MISPPTSSAFCSMATRRRLTAREHVLYFAELHGMARATAEARADELVELLGSANAGLQLSGNPSCVLMVGLHGSGKTTSSGKLGRLLLKQGRTPLLVAADVYRPAAMEQLETVGKQLELPVYAHQGETDVLKIAREALDFLDAPRRLLDLLNSRAVALLNRTNAEAEMSADWNAIGLAPGRAFQSILHALRKG